ncbi:hypothetical protein H4Q26_010279 [Puccinia striiformis f. sp. tritici PST-130]|nr:hypothetical protein H4Q26_010279 [Puccinia striiformis f. sp. tritici PST-130]
MTANVRNSCIKSSALYLVCSSPTSTPIPSNHHQSQHHQKTTHQLAVATPAKQVKLTNRNRCEVYATKTMGRLIGGDVLRPKFPGFTHTPSLTPTSRRLFLFFVLMT